MVAPYHPPRRQSPPPSPPLVAHADSSAWAGVCVLGYSALSLGLVALKACGLLPWPWVLVLVPLWVPTAMAAGLVGVTAAVGVVAAAVGRARGKK